MGVLVHAKARRISVIASKAKQSSPTVATGLLRCARNDGLFSSASLRLRANQIFLGQSVRLK